ncbi:MFS transporter [Leucobacter sp. M11]|uniref:MFS transporter n=1 Tax=Leucobacter sp. M11 TaxID=2993565 RepID=UPI002D7ED726|nr:MFS transporter [Leucobacter sp. M11]MEB4614733.1 MFS transporter [Leucobacter sp. M11]
MTSLRAHTPDPPRRPTPRGTSVFGLAATTLLAALGTSVANVALPTLATAFAAPEHLVQWVVLAYLLAMTLSALLVGRLGDRLGRYRVLVAGLGLFLVATLAAACSPSLGWLVAARAVQGIAGAALVSLPIAIVRDRTAAGRTGAAMGALGSSAAIGTALGPAGGGLLLSAFGWPALFVAMLPIGLLALALLWRERPAPETVAARLPSTPRNTHDRRSPLSAGPLRRGLSMNLLVSAVMMSTLVVGPFYLTSGLGMTPATVGLTLAIGPLAAAASGWLAGRLVDRSGTARSTRQGLTIMLAGIVLLATAPVWFGVGGYALALIVLTPGYQLFLAANNTGVMAAAGSAQRGYLSGALSLSRNLGFLAGASLLGGLYALAQEHAETTTAQSATSAMQLTYAAATGLILAALTLSAGLRRRDAG